MSKIKFVVDTHLFIFSPHTLHREAWRALLVSQPGIFIAGTLTEPSEIGAQMLTEHACTILVDLATPRPEIAHRFRSMAPDTGLLFLVPSFEPSTILPLLQAGATGFVSRDASVGDLARAIIAAGRGEFILPPEIAVQSLLALAQGQPMKQKVVTPLSERETEVLRLLAQGFTNKDIAQTLFLSVRTVEAHLRGIFAKLGVSSRTEAALWAVQHGFAGHKF